MMTTANSLIVSVVMLLGLHSVHTSTINSCVSFMKVAERTGVLQCSAVTDYSKCVLRESGYYKSTENDNENMMNERLLILEMMKEHGISCDVDFSALAEELREEDLQRLTVTIRKLTEYTYPQTASECIVTYKIAIHKGKKVCRATKQYAKCVIKLLEIYKQNIENYDQLGMTIENELAQHGVFCHIDARGIVEEILIEQIPASGSHFCPLHLIAMISYTVFSVFVFH